MNRVDEIKGTVYDAKLEQARQRLVSAATFDPDETDAANERIEEPVTFGSQFLPKDISPDGKGTGFIESEDIKRLRPVVAEMYQLQYEGFPGTKGIEDWAVNIIRG